jgi:Arc/MetJ-type ribon-helix-helix transcriptional regulator
MPKQVAAKLSDVEYNQIRRIVRSGLFINSSDFVRDAIRRRLSEIESAAKPGSGKLKDELYRYMKEREGLVWPDDAARDLGYSVLEILEALRKLEREGKAQEAEGIPVEA